MSDAHLDRIRLQHFEWLIMSLRESFSYLDPELVYEKCVEKAEGFENALGLFPSNFNIKQVLPELSGMCVLKLFSIFFFQINVFSF
jgi:hypothetical protein